MAVTLILVKTSRIVPRLFARALTVTSENTARLLSKLSKRERRRTWKVTGLQLPHTHPMPPCTHLSLPKAVRCRVHQLSPPSYLSLMACLLQLGKMTVLWIRLSSKMSTRLAIPAQVLLVSALQPTTISLPQQTELNMHLPLPPLLPLLLPLLFLPQFELNQWHFSPCPLAMKLVTVFLFLMMTTMVAVSPTHQKT